MYAETMGLIQPAPPTVSKARFLRVFCGQKVEVKYLYSGGFKGESTFEWMRSVTGTQVCPGAGAASRDGEPQHKHCSC